MCLLIPQPHLLVEIVVKQDQVEVPLQAPQTPSAGQRAGCCFPEREGPKKGQQ